MLLAMSPGPPSPSSNAILWAVERTVSLASYASPVVLDILGALGGWLAKSRKGGAWKGVLSHQRKVSSSSSSSSEGSGSNGIKKSSSSCNCSCSYSQGSHCPHCTAWRPTVSVQ